MAAPSYTEDLTDIDLAESASTGWTAFNISGGGGGTPAFGADLGIQGAGCWDKPCSNAERGLAVNKTPGVGTVAAGVHIYVWGIAATPGITDNLATRGAYVLIGTSTTDYMQFHVEGNDTYGVTGRTGKCYPVDYHTTANTGSIPYSTKGGTPGATPTYFGFGLKTTATAKGSNIGCDAVRYGTGGFITAGDATTPATFLGFNTQSDSNTNAWGILTNIGGSYELQGKFVIGQDNTGTPTAAYFDDSSGATIVIPDTVHSSTDFSEIIIDHASTTFNLAGASFRALGTNNVGALIFNNASTVAALDNNTFGPIGVTTLRDAVVATGNTWKQSGQITQNGATITGGTIRESSASSALLIDTALEAADVTGVSFVDNNSGGGAVNTYYINDGTPSDPNSYWAGDANAFDGSTTTNADNNQVGVSTVTTGYLEGSGTNAPASGAEISSVRARLYALGNASQTYARISTSGAEVLGTCESLTSGGDAYGNYVDLSTPTGGWSWSEVQNLVARAYSDLFGANNLALIEIEVTAPNGHSIELTATGSHTFTDITFSGGGGTPGSNLTASSGSTAADVYNNSGGAITINVTGGDSPSVRNAAGSTTTVTATVPVTVTVVDKNNDPISGVQTSVHLSSDDTEVINADTNGSGVVTGTLDSSLTPAVCYIRTRNSTTGGTRYLNFSTLGTIEASTGLNVTIGLTEDTIVAA